MKKLSVLGLVLAACGGGPKAGDQCTGEIYCEQEKVALFCEGVPPRTFKRYDCPGPNGCTANASVSRCDVVGTPAGADCPEFFASKAFCSTDGTKFFQCHAQRRIWEATNCPGGCVESAGQVTCRP